MTRLITHNRKLSLAIAIAAIQIVCLVLLLNTTLKWQEELMMSEINSERRYVPTLTELAELRADVDQVRYVGISLIGLCALSLGALTTLIIRTKDIDHERQCDHFRRDADERTEQLLSTQQAVILGLAQLAEFRDFNTGQHLERIGNYVEILARCLRDEEPEDFGQLDDRVIHELRVASALHDIGKVGIPDDILLKPDALTDEERALLEDHPIIGGECIGSMEQQMGKSGMLKTAKEVAYSHHEWWDGTGYPFKLEGRSIPLSARIVALADVYDALTSARPYKKGLSHEKSKEIILEGMGTQFDPAIVAAFLLREEEFKAVAADSERDDLEKADDDSTELSLSTLDQVRR